MDLVDYLAVMAKMEGRYVSSLGALFFYQDYFNLTNTCVFMFCFFFISVHVYISDEIRKVFTRP